MTLQSRGVVNLIYLIRFVGLERRRLNRIQLIYLLLKKEIFLVYSFSEHFKVKGYFSGKFLRDYLINAATCLFARR